ncbi:DUF1566 domain-containing protein [Thermodesulfobacteriota bacterium]
MRERNKLFQVLTIIIVFIGMALFIPGLVGSGDLDPSGPPGSTMHTLDEIYNKLETMNPCYDPSCANCDGAPVEKTGQTTSYATGDDGDLGKGTEWPDSRFTDNNDGTVTDNLTGLIWLKNANCFDQRQWAIALSDCNNLGDGSCGLTDGSIAGDWRLSNIKELQSLIDFGRYNPMLPTGHPFTGVQSDPSSYYWSATTYVNDTPFAWSVSMHYGFLEIDGKDSARYVWPVRSGD